MLAIATGFCAWINFSALETSKSEMADHRMLRWRKFWPGPGVPNKWAIWISLYSAVFAGFLSLCCIGIGAVMVSHYWSALT